MTRERTRAGFVESKLLELIGREAEVRRVESVGPSYRVVTMQGADLEHRSFTPGDMVQISFGGWESRAYTPFTFDPATGTVEFLGYVHGGGMGSRWLTSTSPGERRFLVGPRRALDLEAVGRPALFFGDETSISTAAALRATAAGTSGVTFVLEVGDVAGARDVLGHLGITEEVTLVPREEDDAHLARVLALVQESFRSAGAHHGVFTGRAAAIAGLYPPA